MKRIFKKRAMIGYEYLVAVGNRIVVEIPGKDEEHNIRKGDLVMTAELYIVDKVESDGNILCTDVEHGYSHTCHDPDWGQHGIAKVIGGVEFYKGVKTIKEAKARMPAGVRKNWSPKLI